MLVVPKYSMRAWFWTRHIFYLVHYLTSHNDGGARPFLKISHAVCLFPESEWNSIIIITDIITLTIISISRISPVWLFPDCLLALSSARLIAGSGSGRMQCALCLYLLLNLHVEVMYHWSLCIMQFNAMVRRLHSIYILIPIYLNQHVGVFMYHIFTWAFLFGAMQC